MVVNPVDEIVVVGGAAIIHFFSYLCMLIQSTR